MMASGKVSVFNTMNALSASITGIPGTQCISCEEIGSAPVLPPDKDRTLVFYSESGGCMELRSADAAIRYGQTGLPPGGRDTGMETGRIFHGKRRADPRMPVVSVKAPELKKCWRAKNMLLVDIRSERSFKDGHIDGAVDIPLYQITRRYDEIPLDRTVVLIDRPGLPDVPCGSYLERKGLEGDCAYLPACGAGRKCFPKRVEKETERSASYGFKASEN